VIQTPKLGLRIMRYELADADQILVSVKRFWICHKAQQTLCGEL
jgi:hypothetical protein